MTLRDELAAAKILRDEAIKFHIKPIDEQIAKIKQKIADESCPFKVGDKVKNWKNRIGIVISVMPGRWGSDYECQAQMFRKNGTQGQQVIYMYSFDEWRKI